MLYPNRIISKAETDAQIVSAVQQQLNAKGCGPVDEDGVFGNQTFRAQLLMVTLPYFSFIKS